MKIRLLFIVTLLAGIVSACGEKDIAVFEGRNQIYFEKFYMNAISKQKIILHRLGIGKRFAFWVENGGRGNNGKAGRV